jgi:hypothetical protein
MLTKRAALNPPAHEELPAALNGLRNNRDKP